LVSLKFIKKKKLLKKNKLKKKNELLGLNENEEELNENNKIKLLDKKEKKIETLLQIDRIKKDLLLKKKELLEKEKELLAQEKELVEINTVKKKKTIKKKIKILFLPYKKDKNEKKVLKPKQKKITHKESEAIIKLFNNKPKMFYHKGYFFEEDEEIYPLIKPYKIYEPTLNVFWCDYNLSLGSGRLMDPLFYELVRGEGI
jgi:hypothetical protein